MTISLTTEQEFSLKVFEVEVSKLGLEDSQKMLLSLYRLMMGREAAYKHLISQDWGLDKGPEL